jgi:formate/nitrite transporter FocA (FNT family)
MNEENDSSKSADSQEIEATEIFATAVRVGTKRLNRPSLEMAISGFIAGMNVAFGALAAAAVAGSVLESFGTGAELFATVLGALVFPIGFIFVVVGRSELFTENFLVPTAAVIARKAKTLSLLRLWALTLVGNLLGAVAVATMVSLEHYHGVPGVHTVDHIHHLAEYLVIERDWDASFYSGIFAGWLITLMTWLLLTTNGTLPKMALIWCVGFLIMLNSFNHVVVNGAEILMAMLTGNELVTVDRWLARSFLPTLLGNMIGGLVFVTLLEYLKVMRSAEKWL